MSVLKDSHSSNVASWTLIVVPSARKANAMRISERISAKPILWWHLRHLPRRMIHEIIGILSYQANLTLQCGQIERLFNFFMFLCVDLYCMRRTWQQRNEPKQAPKTKSSTKNMVCITILYHDEQDVSA